MEKITKSIAIDIELNVRTKEIQKYLIKHLELTPRRQLFEEQSLIASEVDEKKLEALGNDEALRNFNWTLITELQEFREENPRDCMSSINHKRLQRTREQESDFLGSSCNHNRGNTGKTDKKFFCESQESLNSTKSSPKFKSLRFAPENSLALTHQKFKY